MNKKDNKTLILEKKRKFIKETFLITTLWFFLNIISIMMIAINYRIPFKFNIFTASSLIIILIPLEIMMYYLYQYYKNYKLINILLKVFMIFSILLIIIYFVFFSLNFFNAK